MKSVCDSYCVTRHSELRLDPAAPSSSWDSRRSGGVDLLPCLRSTPRHFFVSLRPRRAERRTDFQFAGLTKQSMPQARLLRLPQPSPECSRGNAETATRAPDADAPP